MLKNEKYIGDAMYQRTYMTDTLSRQCLRNRGERDRYYATNTHPGILLTASRMMSERIRERYMAMYTGIFYRRYILGEWCLARA